MMNIFLRLPLLTIFATILLASCSSKSDVKLKQSALYFGVGTQSLMQQDYTAALTALIKADELDPNNSDILNNLGMAYYFKGEKALAVKTLHRSLEINDNNSDAKVNLATIFYQDGDIKQAEKLYKDVLKDLTYDKQARNIYNLGVIELYNKKDTIAAEEYFKKSIKEDGNYCPSFFQLGLIQYNRKQFNKAQRNFREASLGTCLENPSAHYYQALSLMELRRYDDARLKLEDIQSRFKRTPFATNAQNKMLEINELERRNKSEESHASRKMLESPEF